jgi:hypothetical protein
VVERQSSKLEVKSSILFESMDIFWFSDIEALKIEHEKTEKSIGLFLVPFSELRT